MYSEVQKYSSTAVQDSTAVVALQSVGIIRSHVCSSSNGSSGSIVLNENIYYITTNLLVMEIENCELSTLLILQYRIACHGYMGVVEVSLDLFQKRGDTRAPLPPYCSTVLVRRLPLDTQNNF